MVYLYLLIIIFSLLILVYFSEWILDGSIFLAQKLKLSPLIIGSTVVATGTILPSIAVNFAVLFMKGANLDVAVGNMIGTNYVNLGLALGIPAFMTTIITKKRSLCILLCLDCLQALLWIIY